jgi:hypothetical protein
MTLKPARSLALALFALLAAALLSPAGATAARSSVPTVSAVAPMNVTIGGTLTITGRNFRTGRNRNTVVFKRDGQRAVFVKAASATSTRIRVTVPAKLSQYLSRRSGGAARPSRFRLRVLSTRFGRAFTATKLSPVIAEAGAAPATPAPGKRAPAPAPAPAPKILDGNGQQVVAPVNTDPDCDADGQPNSADTDDDNDFLPDTLEATLKTSPCNADTDGDGMQDGWEYQSATDLNRISCPALEYPVPCTPAQPTPTKRKYPNPLDGSDGVKDFDGDSLYAYEEFEAWYRKPGHSIAGGMWYSDGLQASIDDDDADGCRGMTVPTFSIPASLQVPLPSSATWVVPAAVPNRPAYQRMLDLDGDGCLTDDERDEDGDWLTNYDELRGRMTGGDWWNAIFEETSRLADGVDGGTDWLDADSDGDLVIDAFDDQDNDDFLNIEELERGVRSESVIITKTLKDGNGVPLRDADGNIRTVDEPKYLTGTTGLWVNAFDPCMPYINSRTCDRHRPIGDTSTPFDEEAPNKWPLWGSYAPFQGPVTEHLKPLPY